MTPAQHRVAVVRSALDSWGLLLATARAEGREPVSYLVRQPPGRWIAPCPPARKLRAATYTDDSGYLGVQVVETVDGKDVKRLQFFLEGGKGSRNETKASARTLNLLFENTEAVE